MDKRGLRLVLDLGAAILGLSYFSLVFVQTSPNLALFFLLFLMYGVGYVMVSQIRVAITDMYEPKKAGRAVAYLYTASIIGSIATIPVVAPVGSLANVWRLDVYVLLWLARAISIIPAIIVILLVKLENPKA